MWPAGATLSSTCRRSSGTTATGIQSPSWPITRSRSKSSRSSARSSATRAPVKSSHHQGFGRLGEGLREAAWAEDGTVEALEDPSHRFALGVLWHPEEGEDFALFKALVDEAAEYRS